MKSFVYRIALAALVALNYCFMPSAGLGNSIDSAPNIKTVVSIEFASAQDAAKATLVPTELPVGKKLALSARWDDTNWNHRHINKAMHENGWKATFYLNSIDDNYVKNVIKPFVANGSTIGSHTNNHPSLNLTTPNAMFYQILNNRVELESATDQCVVGFTFPNGLSSSISDPKAIDKMAQCLIRSQLHTIAEPEYVFKPLNLDKSEMVACWLFRADDRNPQLEVFNRGFEGGMERLANGRLAFCGPYFVLGIHAWQNQSGAEGFERLSKIIATQSNRPDVWYCTNNEYAAYRLTYLNCKIRKTGQSADGKTVYFEITRPAPYVLGAAVEQGFQVSPAPKSVTYKKELPISDNNEFMLPAKGSLPTKIGCANESNGFVSPKFPGLRFEIQLDVATNRICGNLKNESGSAITDALFAFRLPLKWENGVIHKSLLELTGKERLDNAESAEFCFPLGAYSADSQFNDDDLYCVCEMNFLQDGQKRLYSEATVKQPFVPKTLPRDVALFTGCVSESDLTDETFAPLSVPGAELKPVNSTPFGQWRQTVSNAQTAAYVVEAAPKFENGVKQPSLVYAFEFTCPEGEKEPVPCVVKSNLNQMNVVWLNGKRIEPGKNGEFTATPGVNRILVAFTDGWTYYIRKCELYIATQDGKPVECRRCKTENQ